MNLFTDVCEMVEDLLDHDFIYDGESYNMNEMGWTFSWNNNKSRLGVCKVKINRRTRIMHSKSLGLSKWLINNSGQPFSTWENTMLHEIAHAIDYERRNKSDHSLKWKKIAKSIGCDAERTTTFDLDVNKVITKYTMVCHSCKLKTASHKKVKRTYSCAHCSPGKYDERYKLEQVQNY